MKEDTKVIVYSASWCGPCASAKSLLSDRGIVFTEIDIEEKGMTRDDLFAITGGRTVPQIIIDEKSIGGYDALVDFDSNGLLIF